MPFSRTQATPVHASITRRMEKRYRRVLACGLRHSATLQLPPTRSANATASPNALSVYDAESRSASFCSEISDKGKVKGNKFALSLRSSRISLCALCVLPCVPVGGRQNVALGKAERPQPWKKVAKKDPGARPRSVGASSDKTASCRRQAASEESFAVLIHAVNNVALRGRCRRQAASEMNIAHVFHGLKAVAIRPAGKQMSAA